MNRRQLLAGLALAPAAVAQEPGIRGNGRNSRFSDAVVKHATQQARRMVGRLRLGKFDHESLARYQDAFALFADHLAETGQLEIIEECRKLYITHLELLQPFITQSAPIWHPEVRGPDPHMTLTTAIEQLRDAHNALLTIPADHEFWGPISPARWNADRDRNGFYFQPIQAQGQDPRPGGPCAGGYLTTQCVGTIAAQAGNLTKEAGSSIMYTGAVVGVVGAGTANPPLIAAGTTLGVMGTGMLAIGWAEIWLGDMLLDPAKRPNSN